MQTPKASFELLSNVEFAKLTQEEKIAYLKRAMEEVTKNTPVPGFVTTPSEDEAPEE